ncbi:MAG: protein kinase [Planctomycetota bacterium]
MTGSPEPIGSGGSDSHPDLFDFVSLLLGDRARGQERPLGDYLERFPGHEQAITAEFERLRRDADDKTSHLGPYRIVRTLGRGGQGVVYLAEDARLQRQVALKILSAHPDFVSAEHLARFRREAAILSQLDHPGICDVFEADTVDGVPYLAMRYLDGQTLAECIRRDRADDQVPRARVDLHRAVGWIEAAARALHEAHEAGVVHRDIKPGNILITEDRPVLLDFGLARTDSVTAGDTVTRTGTVMGTLAYMAPELLGSRATQAGRRADVYSLGVTLYECLTHRLPFEADSEIGLARAIETEEPVEPRSRNPAIPVDLAAVVTTAIARAPGRRYATALDLAEDLARVRRREPVRARRPTIAARVTSFMRRHPTLTIGLIALLLLTVVLALALKRAADDARVVLALNRALTAGRSDEQAAAALAELVDAARRDPGERLHSALLPLLDHCLLSYRVPRMAPRHMTNDPPPAIDRDGRRFALGDSEGVVTLLDAADGHELNRRALARGALHSLAFFGDSLLACTGDGSVLLLSLPSLQPSGILRQPGHGVACAAVAADGRTLVIADGTALHLLDEAGRSERRLPLPDGAAPARLQLDASARFALVLGHRSSDDPDAFDQALIADLHTDDGAVWPIKSSGEDVLHAEWHGQRAALVLAYNGGRVEVYDVAERRPVFVRTVGQEVNWCGFDPTGDLLLVPSDRETTLWRWRDDSAAPFLRLPHTHHRTVGAAAFLPARELLATVHRDGTIVIRSTRDWGELRTFRQRMLNVRFLQWLGDSGRLLTAEMHSVSGWDTSGRRHLPELFSGHDVVTTLDSHPSLPLLATGSRNGDVRLWWLDERRPPRALDHGDEPVLRVCFSPDGHLLATATEDGRVRVWNVEDGGLCHVLAGHEGAVETLLFTGDGEALISAGSDGRCLVWDLAHGTRQRELRGDAPIRSAALHPVEPWLAAGCADRWLVVWNWRTGEVVHRVFTSSEHADWRTNPIHQVRGVCFDDHGNLWASLVNNYLLRFDRDWQRHATEDDRFGGALVIDSGSGLLLSADYSFGRLSLCNETGITPVTVDGHAPHDNKIAAVHVARAGGRALSAGHDGRLWVWDLDTARPLLRLHCATAILDAVFTHDGAYVVTACEDGTVKAWPTDPVRAAVDYLGRRQ